MKVKFLLISFVAALALAGCGKEVKVEEPKPIVTPKPYPFLDKLVAEGKLAADERDRLIAGFKADGIASEVIDSYMAVVNLEMGAILDGTGATTAVKNGEVVVSLPGNGTFVEGSPHIRPELRPTLQKLAVALNEYRYTAVEINGHTDSVGSAATNMKLSKERAASVMDYLSGFDVNPKRMMTVGHGESSPIASNKTSSGRESNRRVEIVLIAVAH